MRQFTSRWRKEYLLNLRENSQVNRKRQTTEELTVGDIVIIKNDKTNRSFWRLGRIEQLIAGGDGMNRAAMVKVSNEDGKSGMLRRSIEHLVPLEVNANISEIKPDEDRNLSLVRDSDETPNRPRRAAAIASEDLRRELLDNKLIIKLTLVLITRNVISAGSVKNLRTYCLTNACSQALNSPEIRVSTCCCLLL